jgi:hypothetical protein
MGIRIEKRTLVKKEEERGQLTMGYFDNLDNRKKKSIDF